MSPNVKFTLGGLMVAALIGYLAFVGAAASWQYYLSVDEAVADMASLRGKRIRVSGRVMPGTLTINENRREAEFYLASATRPLHVACKCVIPDNLAINIDVVVEGKLQEEGLLGQKLITRCASKYQSSDAVARNDRAKSDASRQIR